MGQDLSALVIDRVPAPPQAIPTEFLFRCKVVKDGKRRNLQICSGAYGLPEVDWIITWFGRPTPPYAECYEARTTDYAGV